MARARRLGRRSALRKPADRTRLSLRGEQLESRLALSTSPAAFESPNEADAHSLVQSVDWQGKRVDVLTNEWIARFDGISGQPDAQVADIQHLLSGLAEPIGVMQYLGRDGTVLISSTLAAADLQSSLEAVAGFEYVEPNFTLTLDAVFPNDPLFSQQWWLNQANDVDIDAPEGWQVTTGSGNVVLGVIDTGVDYTHADLTNNIWINPGEIPGNGIDDDLNGYVDDVQGWDFAGRDNNPADEAGHGTSVAGIIAAEGNNGLGVSGVNWDAQVMPLRYLNENLIGSTADAIAATNYATMMRTEYGVNVRALNNSYGIAGYSQAFYDAIAAAGDAGIMFIASAGNNSSDDDTGPIYPANFDLPNVISVAAIDSNDNLASFSSYGAATVELGAPGVSVRTTARGGGYTYFGGTSAAAPVVTGVVGLLWDAAPYATLDQIRQALLDGTVATPALSGKTITGGRVNLANSLDELGLRVVSVTPDDGELIHTAPSDFTVTFGDDYDPLVLNAASFTVNGLVADSVIPTNARTLTFHFNASPVTSEGLQTVHMAAAGAVRAATGPRCSN